MFMEWLTFGHLGSVNMYKLKPFVQICQIWYCNPSRAGEYLYIVYAATIWHTAAKFGMITHIGDIPFNALSLLVGWQEGHPAGKSSVLVMIWLELCLSFSSSCHQQTVTHLLQVRCPSCHPTNGVEVLRASGTNIIIIIIAEILVIKKCCAIVCFKKRGDRHIDCKFIYLCTVCGPLIQHELCVLCRNTMSRAFDSMKQETEKMAEVHADLNSQLSAAAQRIADFINRQKAEIRPV